jgi:hypothetical protein
MPSLLNTTVATNYQAMPQIDSYGTDAQYSNFGTRNLRAITVTLSGGTLNNMLYQDGNSGGSFSATSYVNNNSVFSQVIRTVQAFGEIYYVGIPTATAVTLLVSGDTINGAEASSNVQAKTYGALEAAIKSFIDNRTAAAQGAGAAGTATTVTVTGSLPTAAGAIFVGGAVGTYA